MGERAPLDLTWTRISETGEREANQDALGEAQDGSLACFVLADGAGGHAGGEVAANLVVDTLLAAFAAQPAAGAGPLHGYVRAAAEAVAAARLAKTQQRDMSATVAALLIDRASGQALWAHLGDSRVYLFRRGRVHAVTKDHSVTQQFIDAGLAKADQLRVHPQRNMLFAAIGAEGDTALAVSDPGTVLTPGDALLLCSDGLWEWVLEAEMEDALAASADCAQWLEAMCRQAEVNNRRAGKARDNFSAYAIRTWEAQP